MDDFYNPILATDSYNTSHYKMFPHGAKYLQAYWGPRAGGRFDRVLFYGLQGMLQKYLTIRVTRAHIEEAEWFLKQHGTPFNRKGWEYILNHHYGKLPLQIDALPEGSMVPAGIPALTITNTDPECAWLVTYLEPLFHHIWYPTSVATLSRKIGDTISEYWSLNSDTVADTPDFALHDFGMRGATSYESACIGGSAHLLTFKGTDTMPGIQYAMKYYGADVCGHSVPAANHATITAWQEEREAEAYEHIINTFGEGIVSIVADAYDINNAIEQIFCKTLKTTVRNVFGRVVIRPDSGDPVEGILSILKTLEQHFPVEVNRKGFKVLPDYLRVLWGDGIDEYGVQALLEALHNDGWAANNLVCGMGGALLQKVNRDDGRFSVKASAISYNIGGQIWEPIRKVPKSDPSKASLGGRITVMGRKGTGELQVDDMQDPLCTDARVYRPAMNTVFKDGELVRTITFEEVELNSRVSNPK